MTAPRHGATTTAEHVARVLELRAEGSSQSAIATELGLATGTVSKILGGWRPVGRRAERVVSRALRERGSR